MSAGTKPRSLQCGDTQRGPDCLRWHNGPLCWEHRQYYICSCCLLTNKPCTRAVMADEAPAGPVLGTSAGAAAPLARHHISQSNEAQQTGQNPAEKLCASQTLACSACDQRTLDARMSALLSITSYSRSTTTTSALGFMQTKVTVRSCRRVGLICAELVETPSGVSYRMRCRRRTWTKKGFCRRFEKGWTGTANVVIRRSYCSPFPST